MNYEIGFKSNDVREAIEKLERKEFCASDILPFLPRRYVKFAVSQILWRMFKGGELERIIKSGYRLNGKPSYKTEPIYKSVCP